MGHTDSGTNTTGYRRYFGNRCVRLTNPASANPQVHSRGNQSGWITHGGILALQRGEEVKSDLANWDAFALDCDVDLSLGVSQI